MQKTIIHLDDDITIADLADLIEQTDLRIKADGCGGWLLMRDGESLPPDTADTGFASRPALLRRQAW